MSSTTAYQDPISIRERPAEVEDRAIPGQWEGDLLRGSGNCQALSPSEAKTQC